MLIIMMQLPFSPEQDKLHRSENAGNSAVTFDFNLSNFQQAGQKCLCGELAEEFQKLDDLTVVNRTLSAHHHQNLLQLM